jgi:tetratricopeptide (TPR) repeat protein
MFRHVSKFLIFLPLLCSSSMEAREKRTSPPDFDVGEFVNSSYNFLLNREPEMTRTEYALYEQVLPMIFKEPEVATVLLETMLADDDPESPAFSYVLANVYFSSERYDLAEKYFKAAIQQYPDFLRAWINLGFLYYTQERYAEAIPCLTKAISLGSQDPQVRGLLGYCLIETNNPLAAEAALLQAFAADPENGDWIEALLNLYLETRQFERAEPLIRQLIKLHPGEASNWTTYSSMLLSADRKIDAITVLETQKSLGLSGLNETLLLADLYVEHQLFPEALATYQAGFQIDAEVGTDRLLRYAQSLIRLGSLEKAERVLTALHEQDPSRQTMDELLTRAQLYQARGDSDRAMAVLEEILSKDPMNGNALLERGKLYAREANYPKAEFLYLQALKISDSAFEANIELANLALKSAHYQKGINYLRNALGIQPRPEIEAYILKLETIVSSSY